MSGAGAGIVRWPSLGTDTFMSERSHSGEDPSLSTCQSSLGNDALRPMVIFRDGPNPLVRMNTQFVGLLGHTNSDLETRPLIEWIHPDDRERFKSGAHENAKVKARMLAADGSWVGVEWDIRTDHRGNNAFLGLPAKSTESLSCILEPTTREYESTLLSTLDSLARVVEANYLGLRCSILLVDDNQEIVTSSAGPSLTDEYHKAVEGMRISPTLGSCGTAAFWNHPIIVDDVSTDPLWRGLEDIARLSGITSCWSFPVTATNGKVVGALALYSNQPSSPTPGQMQGLEITARMIALEIERDALACELKEASERERDELARSLQVAEDASRMKSDFLANVSHELRTPMNGVIGMTDLVLESELTDEQREYLQMAQTCGIELLDLLNDLLDVSKIEAGMLELECIDFNAMTCVEDAVSLMMRRASEKDVELICNIETGFATSLRGDPTRLRQVIVNLCSNAIKFTDEGEIEVRVRTEDRSDGRIALTCMVRDTGVGIPKDRQQEIFESFTQADVSTTRNFGGTGLGLTISAQLVEMMGGSLEVESEVGEGSTFSFTALLDQAEYCEPHDSHAELRDCPVLIADDNDTTRGVLHALVDSWGCEAVSVGSGAEALQRVGAAKEAGCPFRLILIDSKMTDMNGYDVAAKMRQSTCPEDAAIIMLHDASIERPGASETTPAWNAIVTKPVRRTSILDAVLAALSPVTS